MKYLLKYKDVLFYVFGIWILIGVTLAIVGKPIVTNFTTEHNIDYNWYMLTRWTTFIPLVLVSYLLFVERRYRFLIASVVFVIVFNPHPDYKIELYNRNLWFVVDFMLSIFVLLIFLRNEMTKNKNHQPKRLVKLLTKFTTTDPFKLTTHLWHHPDEYTKKYINFDGYLEAVKKEFKKIESELLILSPNLHKKIHTFLVNENPTENDNWSSKVGLNINMGWSSLKGLKEHCNNGQLPGAFIIEPPIFIGRQQINHFADIVDMFKMEIEVRSSLQTQLDIDLTQRDFYTDTQTFLSVINRIFADMKRREVDNKEFSISSKISLLDDNSVEIRIIQANSFSNKDGITLLDESKDGDFGYYKSSLSHLCDWSIENSIEGKNFRVNYLHDNNVKNIESLNYKPAGFTYVFRFYR